MSRGRKKKEIHPGQECGPCHLCHQNSMYYSHLATWEEALKTKLREVTLISEDKCICRKCEKDIKRNTENIGSNTYTPRWLHSAAQCMIQGCQNKKPAINTSMFDKDSVSKLLGLEVRPDTTHISLCEEHYKKVYDQVSGVSRVVLYTVDPH